MNPPLGSLSYRQQSRHLTRLKISERAPSELVLMPDLTSPALVLAVEPVEQIAHLPKHEALTSALAHRAQIKRALSAGVRSHYSRHALLVERRRVGVLNRKIAQAVPAQACLFPHAGFELQVGARDWRELERIDRALLVVGKRRGDFNVFQGGEGKRADDAISGDRLDTIRVCVSHRDAVLVLLDAGHNRSLLKLLLHLSLERRSQLIVAVNDLVEDRVRSDRFGDHAFHR